MLIERNLQPNCSEAVFRFYTLDPKQIHFILQAIADEVSHNCKIWGKQVIPEFKTAEEYETKYNSHPLLYAIAGLGDNECLIVIEKDKRAFRLNIGNNEISDNKTGWIEKNRKPRYFC
ncbi:MAG: hypothetical protein ABIL44_01055 [candidate division WOR-3 bacterium]